MSGTLTEVILPLSLFIIMLGMGMTLKIEDFKRILVYPKAVSIGLIGQLLLLPVVGFIIVKLFPMTPELAVGVLILAACPGGTTSNIITHLAKGDTALSITLTSITTVVSIITVPLIISFALSNFMGSDSEFVLPVERTMLTLFAITLLPVCIGMIIKAKAPVFADAQEDRMNTFATIFFILLVIIIIIKERDSIIEAVRLSGVACLTLNVFMMGLGYVAARLFKLDKRQTKTISIEIGIQNTTLAFVIIGTILTNPTFAIPAAIYSIIMFLTAGTLVMFSRRKWISA